MEKAKSQKVRVVVLDDGDHTTWCGDAVVVSLPKHVYEMVANDGDSKLLREYIGMDDAAGAVGAVQCIDELLEALRREGFAPNSTVIHILRKWGFWGSGYVTP